MNNEFYRQLNLFAGMFLKAVERAKIKPDCNIFLSGNDGIKTTYLHVCDEPVIYSEKNFKRKFKLYCDLPKEGNQIIEVPKNYPFHNRRGRDDC